MYYLGVYIWERTFRVLFIWGKGVTHAEWSRYCKLAMLNRVGVGEGDMGRMRFIGYLLHTSFPFLLFCCFVGLSAWLP